MVLKTALSIKTWFVILQESFVDNLKLVHSLFHFYWPTKDKTIIRVIMAIKKDLLDKIIGGYRMDLINHLILYFSRSET